MAISGTPVEGNYAAINVGVGAPADNTAAVVTIPAVAAKRTVIRSIDASYTLTGALPALASIAVTFGGVTKWAMGLKLVQAVYHWDFPWGLYNKDAVNEEVVVTLGDPGVANVTGILSVVYE